MSRRLYPEDPIPYGGWALSLALLTSTFIWLRSENYSSTAYTGKGSTSQHWADETESDGSWGYGQEARDETWGHSSSSAYQTDEEARRERVAGKRHSERLRRAGHASYTSDGLASTNYDALGGNTPTDATAAAAAAVRAVRKSHLAHLDMANRARVEREAMRIRLHHRVQRELAKQSTFAIPSEVDLE